MRLKLARCFFYISVILMVLLVGCNQEKVQSIPIGSILESYFDSLARYQDFNGAFLYKEADKIILEKGYGYANYSKESPFKVSTQMEIASVSKQFTSMAIMILREKGLVNIDDPVNLYLDKPLPYKTITVRQLLTHTSGLPKYEDYFYTQWPVDKPCYNKDILNYYRKYNVPLLFVPGTGFNYSNGGYVILAEIVERVSGNTLDCFLNENIFEPYGMKNTGFYDRSTILSRKDYAPGYYFDNERNRMVLPDSLKGKEYVSYLSYRLGPGRISSTVEDLAKWDSLLKSGALISDTSLVQLYTPQPIPAIKSNYALGWRVNMDSISGYHIYHTGSWAGNKTYIGRFVQSPYSNYQNHTTDIINEAKINDQTLIIFNNTHWSKMKEARKFLDSVIISNRKLHLQ